MTHVREQIRDAFATRLASVSGVTTVFRVRPHPPSVAELPALQIVTQSEAIEPIDQGSLATYRRMDVDVYVYAAGDEGTDNTLDDIAAQVESLIMTATGAPWDDMVLFFPTSADFILGDAAEETLMVLRTRFRVEFEASTPDTIGE